MGSPGPPPFWDAWLAEWRGRTPQEGGGRRALEGRGQGRAQALCPRSQALGLEEADDFPPFQDAFITHTRTILATADALGATRQSSVESCATPPAPRRHSSAAVAAGLQARHGEPAPPALHGANPPPRIVAEKRKSTVTKRLSKNDFASRVFLLEEQFFYFMTRHFVCNLWAPWACRHTCRSRRRSEMHSRPGQWFRKGVGAVKKKYKSIGKYT